MSRRRDPRKGLEGVEPGRQAHTRLPTNGPSHEVPRHHPHNSYYGRPIIKEPTWEERDIAGYLFTGGLAGATSLLAAGADLTGRPRLARRCKVCATAALGVSLAALIHDLGRPERFLNMLRVFKPTSPMSVGVWILTAYGPLATGAAASDLTGLAPRFGKAAGLGAGVTGTAVASYTAALIANTAVPAWHEGRRELPLLFVGSASAAGAGFGLLAAPKAENGPARRLAMLGALAELGAEQRLQQRLGMIAETLHAGTAGRRLATAKLLTAVGAIGAATVADRSRIGAMLSGTALLAGSALTRFGLFEAGIASARDPKYTVSPQRRAVEESRSPVHR